MADTSNTDSTGVERIALDNEKAVSRILAQSMRKVQDIVQRKLAAGKDKALAGKGLVDFEQTVRAFYDSLGVKIGRSLRDGLDEGMKEAYDAAKDAMRTDGKRRAILGKPDTATINRYMQGTFEEIAMRTNKMAAEHIRHLREVGAEVFRTAAFTGQTRREVTRELMDKAAQIPGFRFIDNGGTIWKDATYFKMLARTETMNTGRAIYDDTCAKNGYDVVRLSHSGNSCEACSAYEGTIFSLTGATPGIPTKQDLLEAGVFHPNCTHTYTALTDLELEQEGLLDKRDETKNDIDEEADKKEGFPDNPLELKRIASLEGSTGAELVEDENGNKFVLKRGGSAGGDAEGHLRNEVDADNFYRAMGVDVPECKLYQTPEGSIKLSKYIEDGENLGEWWRKASSAEREEMLGKLRPGFDLDVVTGNWDVVGMNGDNILIDKDGKPWRIDNGGSFGFRAQGARKEKEQWGDGFPDEVWSMRTSENNTAYFGNIDTLNLCQSISARDYKQALQGLQDSERAVVEKRLAEIKQLSDRGTPFRQSGVMPEHIDSMLQTSYALSKDGLREKMDFDIGRDANNLPTTFGILRTGGDTDSPDKRSFTTQVFEEIGSHSIEFNGKRYKLDPKFISDCQISHSQYSYDKNACREKIVRLNAMGLDINKADEYYTGKGNWKWDALKDAQKFYNDNPALLKRDTETYIRYQGALQIMLENTNMPYIDHDTRTILLARTENPKILETSTPGTVVDYRRGIIDSHSMFRTVKVEDSNCLTVVRVPFDRISGCYMAERTPYSDQCGFLNDEENEMTADTRGLKVVYMGKVVHNEDLTPYFKEYLEIEKNGFKN